MTDRLDVSQSPPTARELLDSVDALMRRNRRAGGVPLPPPEGQVAFAAFEEETQTLSAEIEAELEAELAKELSRVESDAPSEISEAPATERTEEEAEKQAIETPPENTQGKIVLQTEDDLLLWEFAPKSRVVEPEAGAVAEPTLAGIAEAELTDKEPLSLTPSFSEAVSFLSAPEVLASPAQGSVLYMTEPPTMAFDGMAAGEERQTAEIASEILPEDSLEEKMPSEEAAEVSAELDVGAAINVAKALGLLVDAEKADARKAEAETADAEMADAEMVDAEMVDAETPEVTEDAAEILLPEPMEGLWYLVEPEPEPETVEVEPERAIEATEIEEEIAGDAELFEALLMEELREDEKAEIEAWASSAKKDKAALFAEPEIHEPAAETLVETGDTTPVTTPKASEPSLTLRDFVPSPLKTERASLVSAATLLSEKQQRDDETKTPSMRYSAAQLLTEYRRQNPQMQNVKAAPAAPHFAQAAPASGSALALVDEHDSLSTFNESGRNTAKTEQAKETSPPVKTPIPKGSPLELALEPLSGVKPDQAATASASTSVPLDDDGYPVLTDIVDEKEMSASRKA
jgi:hypothetical protein